MVITARAEVGCIYQHTVWELKRAECVPFARNRRHLSAVQLRIEDRYVEMILSVFDTTKMYFSYSCVMHSPNLPPSHPSILVMLVFLVFFLC